MAVSKSTSSADNSTSSSSRHQSPADALGLAVSAVVAGAGLVAYKLLIRLRWHRHQLTVRTEQLDRVNKDLDSMKQELLNTRSALEVKMKDLNVVITKLEQTRGELGTRTSENQIMKHDLQTAKRQLASMQQQLERTKLELRSSQSNGMWGAD